MTTHQANRDKLGQLAKEHCSEQRNSHRGLTKEDFRCRQVRRRAEADGEVKAVRAFCAVRAVVAR